MKKIALTFDYELFFYKSGTISACLLEPVELLRKYFREYEIKGTFFIDTIYLHKLLITDLEHYKIIAEQLCNLVFEGHRVELHLHPHWLDAHFENEEWKFGEYKNYRLQTLPDNIRHELFTQGVNLLNSLAAQVDSNYKVNAFRAGGWCIQPFSFLIKGFRDAGIKIDSSVASGMYDNTETHVYNFKTAPRDSTYFFNTDPIIPDVNGEFLEIPITTFQTNPYEKILKRYWSRCNPAGGQIIGDGRGMEVGKMVLLRKLFDRYAMFTIDGFVNFEFNLKKMEKAADLITYISHPKNLTKTSLEFLRKFSDEKFQYVTLEDVYKTEKRKGIYG